MQSFGRLLGRNPLDGSDEIRISLLDTRSFGKPGFGVRLTTLVCHQADFFLLPRVTFGA